MAARIVTVTLNPSIDKSCSIDRVVPDRKLRCSELRRDPGGGGINCARVVHRLGGEILALWSRGGPIGDMLRDLLEAEGVPQAPVPIAAITRENLIVSERITGRQYRFGMPGAPLTDDERQEWCERVSELDPPPRYLVLSGSLPPGVPDDFYAELVRAAPEESLCIVDTSGAPLRRALEACPYLIKPNFRELEQIAGRELHGDPAIEAAARELIDRRCASVVLVSLGPSGALLVTADHTELLRAPSVRIVSRVGAGDSAVGGLTFDLARGGDLLRAARFGVAAGAAAVMTEATELCHPTDVERLFATMQ